MAQHTAMLWLPDAMREAGYNVIELDGWDTAQGLYFWTRPEEGTIGDFDETPSLFMPHHTAGTAATPVVRDPLGRWSKANCWMGVERGGRLYSYGDGLPTVVFTSSGPARVSSGYGHWPTALKAMSDERVPWKQTNPDGPFALNRYAWNVEVVHPGDGSPINEGVEEMVIAMGVLLARHFGWSAWRTIGHLSWTARKIDPRWVEVDRIVYIQDQIHAILAEEEEMDPAKIYEAITHGWYQSLTPEEFALADELGLFEGDGYDWYLEIQAKGYEGRTDVENAAVIHLRNTMEISGWGNKQLVEQAEENQ